MADRSREPSDAGAVRTASCGEADRAGVCQQLPVAVLHCVLAARRAADRVAADDAAGCVPDCAEAAGHAVSDWHVEADRAEGRVARRTFEK